MIQIMIIEIRHQHLYFRMYINKYRLINWYFVVNRPLSTRSYRSSSIATDGVGSTPSTGMSISLNQDIPIVVDRYVNLIFFLFN